MMKTTPQQTRKVQRALMQHAALAGILLLALALRLALWSQPLHQPANDEVEYIQVARDLLAGRGWVFYEHYHWLRAPLYPLFLAASLWLAGGDLHRAALPNLALSVGVVYLIYRLTLELAGLMCDRPSQTRIQDPKRPALIAAAIAAVLMTYGTFAGLYMSETLFSFCFTAALVLLLRWKRERRHDARRAAALYLLPAGVCYGLAVLTRSLPLAFLPVVIAWMIYESGVRSQESGEDVQSTEGKRLAPYALRLATSAVRRATWSVLLFTVCVFLTLAPWTLRNCQAYGRCILVETGLSYNLWAFSEPREDQQTIFRILENIPNPAVRADEATRRGMQRLREDPTIILRKIRPNWIALWAVKPIQDRFLMANYYADPPPPVFLAGLIFDDVLYYVVLLAAVLGLSCWLPRRAGVGLPALWLAYVVAVSLVTHGEGRYRHFIFMALIPLAALTIANLKSWRVSSIARHRDQLLVALPTVLLLGFLLYPLRYYPWDWAVGGAARSLQRFAGDFAAARGDAAGAEAAYRRALEANATPDGWLVLGDLYRRQGRLAEAEQFYRFGWSLARPYVGASARLGDLQREQGRLAEARSSFIGIYAAEQNVIDWSWANLNPQPLQRIDVGDGLDAGYVGGVYPAEQQQGASARWTNGRGLLRLAGTAQATPYARFVTLRLAAPHPGQSSVAAQVCAAERCQAVVVGATWRLLRVALPPGAAATQVIELRSPTFDAPDGRQLGVLIDWAAISDGRAAP